MEAVALLSHGEGHGAQVLHLVVAGGRVAAVTAAGEPADLRPLPLLCRKLAVDALQLLLRAVAVKAGVEEGPNLAALVLLVLELVGGQRSQGTIPSSLWWEEEIEKWQSGSVSRNLIKWACFLLIWCFHLLLSKLWSRFPTFSSLT